MKLISPAFADGGKIPSKFTCQGENINPELQFKDIPPQAKALVLLLDDPDVPEFVRKDRMYDHWVVYDISPTTTHIPENTPPLGIEGRNTGGGLGYTGPCPPDREHRYFFKLYALDKMLSLSEGASKADVEKAMQGHIIAEARLMGRYEKHSNDPC